MASSASILPYPRFTAYDANGAPLAGGFVYQYVPGGTTPKTSWQDAAETTPNANPLTLDSAGSALIYGSGQYQLTTTDCLGNQIQAYSGLTQDSQSVTSPGVMVSILNIATLRAQTIGTLPQTQVYVLGYYNGADGGEGPFWYKASDTTTADNGGTIIVDGSGRRWYRETGGGPFSVKWFGAKGDGATNDSGAIQATINYCIAANTGPVFVPSGNYLCNSALTIASTGTGLRMYGASDYSSYLNAGTQNLNLLTLSGTDCCLEFLLISNNIVPNTASATLTLSGCVEAKINSCLVQGGTMPIQILSGGADNVFNLCKVQNSYGNTQIYIEGSSGNYFNRVKIDQQWPVAVPPANAFLGAWTPLTVYTGHEVVTVGSFWLQCLAGGTSGSVLPTIVPYGTLIVDGTATWYVAGNAALTAINIDTNSFYNQINQCDMTGAYRGGLWITNNHAGSGPQKTVITNTEIGTFYEFGIRADAGAGLQVQGVTWDSGISAPAVGIQLSNAWAGDAVITGCLGYGTTNGIDVAAGVNAAISDNMIFGCSGIAVAVESNINLFTITGNQLGQSATWGQNTASITVKAGTSNEYVIVSNNCAGALAGVVDGGTGVTKSVANNI